VAQDKYPYLSGCYVDDGFERKLTREFLQATVAISHYKGAMLLRVLPAPPKRGEAAARLHGDDLDALISQRTPGHSGRLRRWHRRPPGDRRLRDRG
jgi:hypothetical protein